MRALKVTSISREGLEQKHSDSLHCGDVTSPLRPILNPDFVSLFVTSTHCFIQGTQCSL